LAEVPEDRASESFAKVGDDPVRHTEAVFDISDEFNCFFRCYFRNRSDFNPLGEFVYSDQDMFVAARSGTKRSYRVEAPHSEGPIWRNSAQGLSWQVLLFGKELASFAPLDEVFSIGYGCGPIEARSIRLTDHVRGCRMAATLAVVNLS
jgi:hypothetical protein